MLTKSKQLFHKWNEKVVYCHWKSNDHLQEGLDGDTDLDVLLAKEDKETGCAILKEIGFIQFRSQFGSRYPNVEDWLGFDEETGRLLHLHLHYALVTGHTGMKEYELPWTAEALETRLLEPKTGVYIMNPNLELVSLYTRLILKSSRHIRREAQAGRYKMDVHFSKEINYIKKRVHGADVVDIANRYYGPLGHEFTEIVQQEELNSEGYLRLYSIVSDTMENCSRYHGLSHSMHRAYYYVATTLRNILRNKMGMLLITRKVKNPKRGLTIAFLGQDGSGKTTVTHDILRWLTWKVETRLFYMGSGDNFLPWEKRLQMRLELHKNVASWLLRSFLVFSILLKSARQVVRTVKKAKKYKGKGGIALFDRYPQTIYPGINDGPKIRYVLVDKLPRLLKPLGSLLALVEERNIRKAASNSPDIVIKLLLPPEESLRRKPFENYETICRKHEIVKSLTFNNSKVYEVDATQDYEKEMVLIKNIIWENICTL